MSRPSPPDRNNVRTYYERPALNRWTARYTVAWENAEGPQSLRAHNRFTDLEGHPPSVASLMRLPSVVRTYREARRRPILRDPVPFLVWDAIRFLEDLLRPGMRVLEIGSGNSTSWFLRRGCWVNSFEHSGEWATYVREGVDQHLGTRYSARLEQHVVAGDEAIARLAALPDEDVDVVLVDSMNAHTYRPDALRVGRPKLRPGGWMVLDNSDHPNNWPALDTMADRERVRFTGLAPMCAVICQTSFWQV